MESGGSHISTTGSAGKPHGDAAAPAMAASAPDLNTDSGAERFTISLADTPFGPLPHGVKPGFHCARTHWIRGFVAFLLGRRARTVRPTVPV